MGALDVLDAGGRVVTMRAPGTRVIVRLADKATHYGDPSLGIVMHDYSYRQPIAARVLAVGPRAAYGLAVGDDVLVGKYNGFRLDGYRTRDGGEVWSMDADYTSHTREAGPSAGLPTVPDVYGAIDTVTP